MSESESITRNNELYPAVVAGDAAAREAMILNNVGLVVVKADSLICRMPGVAYLRDDLVSAGNIGLVTAANQIATGRVRMEAVTTWIGTVVTRAMWHLLPHEHTIHIPHESRRLARKKNQPIQSPRVFNGFPARLEARSELAVIELRDLLSACCTSEAQRECLRLREAGYTFQEIGTRLGISTTWAQRMFHNLQKRILARWADR
jgi:RNA polymerase sigma factor (sigma-70 family)